MIRRSLLFICLLIMIGPKSVSGADQADLLVAFEQLHTPELDRNAVYSVSNQLIVHHDFDLRIDSGMVVFFKPLKVDGQDHRWGAYFTGRAHFEFRPILASERGQVRRFFGADSLVGECSSATLYFDDRVATSLLVGARRVKADIPTQMNGEATRFHKLLLHGDEHYYLFEILRNAVFPAAERHLMVHAAVDGKESVYLFNPYAREEVQLLRRTSRPSEDDLLELACQYSMYTDDRYFMLNGLAKPLISPVHYDLKMSIDKEIAVTGEAKLRCVVERPETQLIPLELDKRLTVDSVRVGEIGRATGIRYEPHSQASSGLYVFLDQPAAYHDTLLLRLYYHGELGERKHAEFWVDAAADWYPQYGYAEPATFDMEFRTPSDYQLVASGKQVSSVTSGDTVVSKWQVSRPTAYASFNIGEFDSATVEDPEQPWVTVYTNDRLRAVMFGTLEEKPGRQVAEDVSLCLEYFSSKFGNYSLPGLAVTEIPFQQGRSYPGLIHLGSHTFLGDDEFGYTRQFRAHEVAHQWWGAGVGFESYHDSWLSEGFAEYSALLYLETTAGEEAFQKWLEQYRKDIFDVRKTLLATGEAAGPMALGYRTSSTKTEGDYDVIVYRKGAFVLHMIRSLLRDWQTNDDSRFFALMREFYDRYNGGRASTRDFQSLVEKYAGIDMTWFFQQWVYGKDLPTYRMEQKIEPTESGRWAASCTIHQENVPPGFQMWVPLAARFSDNSMRYFTVLVDRDEIQFNLPEMTERPKELILNPSLAVLAAVKQ